MNPFSEQTVNLFDQLLAGFQLQANNPDFDKVAAVISQAKRELGLWASMKNMPSPPLPPSLSNAAAGEPNENESAPTGDKGDKTTVAP